MIEKLEKPKSIRWGDDVDSCIQRHKIIVDAISKINELVEIVNILQTQVAILEEHAHPTAKTIDPEGMEYIKLDNDSVRKFLKEHPEYKNNGVIEIQKKEPTDPFAEQERWIGKLCKFWDYGDGHEDYVYEILVDIVDEDYPYKIVDVSVKGWQRSFRYCEPVSEDLIYKGE